MKNTVPNQLILSGNFEKAHFFLKENSSSTSELAEACYRLGNQFHQAGKKIAASKAWETSALLSKTQEVRKKSKPELSDPTWKYHWQTIGAVILVIICLYVPIFALFQREPEPFQMTMGTSGMQQQSFWDEWWDTGRPVVRQLEQQFGAEDLWPLLKKTLQDLLGQEDLQLSESVRQKLKKWLERSQSPQLKTGPPDFYAITGRGLFDVREYDEAISTYKEGLHFAQAPEQFEQLYQELGTVYYYKGYKLQPNGLAFYELDDVKKSVKAYESALHFGADPYLYGNLGWGYYLLGNYSEAIKNSKLALAERPMLNYARMNMGITYLRMGEHRLSYQTYESLINYSPELEEYEGGIRDLYELQREFPGRYSFTNFVLGHLYWQQGRYSEAKKSFQNFLNQNFAGSLWRNKARRYLSEIGSD